MVYILHWICLDDTDLQYTDINDNIDKLIIRYVLHQCSYYDVLSELECEHLLNGDIDSFILFLSEDNDPDNPDDINYSDEEPDYILLINELKQSWKSYEDDSGITTITFIEGTIVRE